MVSGGREVSLFQKGFNALLEHGPIEDSKNIPAHVEGHQFGRGKGRGKWALNPSISFQYERLSIL